MATESNFVQPAIPKLDAHYDHWCMLMENFLRSKEYWNLIEQGIPTAEAGVELTEGQKKVIEDAKLKDLKVKNYLFQAIDRSVLETIRTKIQKEHLRLFETNAQHEGRRIVNEYFARTLTIANKMRVHGEKMEDVVVIEKILRSMTPKFDYVVCSIEESNDLDTLSIDVLQSVTYEDQSRGRGRGRGGFRGRGRGRSRQSFDKSTIECYNCHKLGHFQYECPNKETETKTQYAEASGEILLMAHADGKEASKEELWFLDSDNSSMAVTGKGNIRTFVNGIVQLITEVFYVPGLQNNLLSVGQLQEKGLAILIQHGKCKIYHPDRGLIMEIAMSSNRIYGHLSFNLKTLQRKDGEWMPQFQAPLKVCEDLVGKQRRNPFQKKAHGGLLKFFNWCMRHRGPINPTSNSKKSPTLVVKDMTRRSLSGSKPSKRDVKFEEENSWDWNKSHEKAIIADLDGRKNFETDHHDITIEAMEGNDSYESNEENPLNPNEERIEGHHLVRDYESGKGLSEEEDTAYQALFVGNDPVSFGDAMKSMKWRKAMDAEIEAIERNDTWELTDLPTEAKKVGVKWIYKTKFNENGEVDKYKARLVAKGYTQEHGVDYTESAFLHGELSEEVFVMQRSDGIFINQKKYTQEVLERFSMDKCNPVHNPMVPGFKLTKNGDGVRVDTKRILRYLKGTIDFGVFYKKGGNEELIAYRYNLWSLCPLKLSLLLQLLVPQAIWLRRILEGLNHAQHDSTTVYCDNSSTIKLSKNPVMHGRCKHIDVRFHFLRELTKDGTVEMVHCHTQEQVADIMTKPLKLDAFLKLRDLLGVCLDLE
ncbi:hypothetical protein AAG906_026237 [Vitis piasezkii]